MAPEITGNGDASPAKDDASSQDPDQEWLHSYIKTKAKSASRKSLDTKSPSVDVEENEEEEELGTGFQKLEKCVLLRRFVPIETSTAIQSSLILKLFGTQTQVDVEEEDDDKDECWMNDYVVHPESPVRRNWDMFAICLVVYTVFVLPTRTAFFWQAS
eukprot:6138519-Pyramimonas_sp.AAC.1